MNRFDPVRRRAAQSELSNAGRPSGDQNPLAGVLRSLRGVPSRRDVLSGLAATGLALGLAALPTLAEAKPKRRKKRKRPKPAKPNQYGCLEVKDPCRRHTQCCSGICTGQPGKKRCRAHGTGTCVQGGVGLCTAPIPVQAACNGRTDCACLVTTGGSTFCADYGHVLCVADCKRDADCVALGAPAGSACVPVGQGICNGFGCPTGMACMPRCGSVPPPAPTP